MVEVEIVHFFNELGRGTIIDNISWLISYIPFLVVLVVILGAIIIGLDQKNWKTVIFALVVALILHFIVSEFIFKYAVTSVIGVRDRPYVDNPGINVIGEKFSDSSFPSSHIAAVTAILFVVVWFYGWAIIPAIIFGMIMAFSRMHNGMHYPSDLLFGFFLGIFYGLVGIYFSQNFGDQIFKM
ncbi:MAG TPA: phosphatase PAP2 family protein [Candidatus Paceibacterota bacterium]|nr:phosphatase PAP2 family protein [Candidatus Paceibacterota bacterium]